MNNNDINNSIVYQIYPTSFYDSDGDGIGDINGITKKLGYISDLGVDILWLNPIFSSPFLDGGYDVKNFLKIDERFGNLEDLRELIEQAHKLNLKIVMDIPIGHTSIYCKWFKKSQTIKKNKYSDYYIWTNSIFVRENNMISGVSERNGCVATNYYSHQPSLNYGYGDCAENEKWKIDYRDERLAPLRTEMINCLKYWLGIGVDGFRFDLASSIVKNCYYDVSPLVWVWSKIISGVKSSFDKAIFVAEWGNPALSVGQCGFDIDYINHESKYYNQLFRNKKGTNVVPELELGENYFDPNGKGIVKEFLEYSTEIISNIAGKGYYAIPTGYHDIPRISKLKSMEQLKVAFAFIITYKNIPFIYYGDEIGMENNDNVSRDGGYNRTGARTPMQWNNDKNRGFSVSDTPYLPTDNNKNICVSEQQADENSLLNIVKKLIKIKKDYNLSYESDLVICSQDNYPLIYKRITNFSTITIMINPSSTSYEYDNIYSNVLLQSNCQVTKSKIKLCSESFIILE